MQLLKGVALTMLFAISSSVLASECIVSTTPRALFSGMENVTEEHFEPEKGKYSATLTNGNTLTARFDLCALGLRASYLIERDDEPLSEKISFLLTRASPSNISASALSSQVSSHSDEDFRRGVVLQGANGNHWVQVKNSPSPLYATVIHYRWIPPEH